MIWPVSLRIYGGFFSGSNVTVLTAVYIVFFRMTFLQAIATTKLVNIFSSGIATAIFMWNGLVDYRLGGILGVTMFAGALIGARYAIHLGNTMVAPHLSNSRLALGAENIALRCVGKASFLCWPRKACCLPR